MPRRSANGGRPPQDRRMNHKRPSQNGRRSGYRPPPNARNNRRDAHHHPPRKMYTLNMDEAHASIRASAPVRRGWTGAASARVVIFLVVAFVFTYMAFTAYRYFTPGISTEAIHLGSMEIQQSVTGIIIRDEQVFYANRAGQVSFNIGDFERVRSGVHVASIQEDIEVAEELIQEMAAVEAMIMGLQDIRHSTVIAPQVERANTNMRNMVNGNMHHFTTGNLSEIHSLHENLSSVSHQRNQLIISENRDVRSALGRDHDQLQVQMEMNSYDMYSNRSGIMSPIIDGAESRFTIENMRQLSREELNYTIDHTTIVPSRQVEEGDPVFKIVGNNWYIAVAMSHEMTMGWVANTDRTVFIRNENTGNYEPMRMRVVSIDYGARDNFVILRSTRNVIDFLGQRNVSIRTTDNISRGFKIATSAISTRNYYRIPITHVHGIGDYYVHHRTDYGIRRLPIEVSNMSGTHAYVIADNIDLFPGDILAPSDIFGVYFTLAESDIHQVHGVYRANLGFADFRQIHIDGDISETDGHVLLDPNRNREIRQFDTIVTDASTVVDGQILRQP